MLLNMFETKNKNTDGNEINKHYFVKSRPYLRYSVIIKIHRAIENKKSIELNIMACCLLPRRTYLFVSY